MTNGDITEVGGGSATVRDDHYFGSYPRTMYLQIKCVVSAENINATKYQFRGFVKLNKLKEIRDNFGGWSVDPGLIRTRLVLYLY